MGTEVNPRMPTKELAQTHKNMDDCAGHNITGQQTKTRIVVFVAQRIDPPCTSTKAQDNCAKHVTALLQRNRSPSHNLPFYGDDLGGHSSRPPRAHEGVSSNAQGIWMIVQDTTSPVSRRKRAPLFLSRKELIPHAPAPTAQTRDCIAAKKQEPITQFTFLWRRSWWAQQ